MKKYFEILKKTELFSGISESDIGALISCLSAKAVHYEKNRYVYLSGDGFEGMGIVLSGMLQIIKEDYYGNRHIIAEVGEGQLFGETFACADIKTLPVSVYSPAESEVLFIDYRKLISPCSSVCSFHSRLIYNMLRIVAMKNIILNEKIEVMSKRSTRDKLIAYLSAEAQKAKSNRFSISFNRQELADYLSVDRSAMSAELGRMRDEGLLKFEKNRFELLL